MKQKTAEMRRRDFLKRGAAIVGGAVSAAGMAGPAFANRHPHPNPGSIDYLDREMYVHNMTVHGHLMPPNNSHRNGIWRSSGKEQMMARGNRRFMFGGGYVYDLTDPLKPEVISDGAYRGGQVQLAFNRDLGKWILMTGASAGSTSATAGKPGGKYAYPEKIEGSFKRRGLRGVRFYDVTDPENIKLLSEWSCDQGDPSRELQTGGGTHRNFYSGGKYAYLDTAPDNSFTALESPWRAYSNCIQTIDASDPEKPKFVSNWWFPGQRASEEEARANWRFAGDRESWTSVHGPMVVPRRVEDGGKYGYAAYGHFGVTIHDVSDPARPRLIGRFDPLSLPGGIPFHTIDVSRIDSHGIIIGSPEPLNPDCDEVYQDTWIIDVRDPTNPKKLARLPRPKPDPEAPYQTFCNKRGRFGPHNPPFNHAPGTPHPSFTLYSYFNGGVQCFDLSKLVAPKISAYFVPPQGGSLDEFASYDRDTDNVFVEWDRKLIWAMTNTGVYLLSTPALGEPILKPMAVDHWALPGLNAGHDG